MPTIEPSGAVLGATVRGLDLPQPLSERDFARILSALGEHGVPVWDHLGTSHRAVAAYRPDDIRLIRRCRVMATKVFDPAFLQPVRQLAAATAA